MRTLEEARAFFQQDRFATEAGIVIDSIDQGGAVCSVSIQPRHLNAAGVVQGGLLFTLADFAFAVAANWNKGPTLTLSSNIHFMRAATEGLIQATATLEHQSKSTCLYRVEVTQEDGTPLALVQITGYILQK